MSQKGKWIMSLVALLLLLTMMVPAIAAAGSWYQWMCGNQGCGRYYCYTYRVFPLVMPGMVSMRCYRVG